MQSVSLWRESMNWVITPTPPVSTELYLTEPAPSAKPVQRDSGMSQSMEKDDPEGALKLAGHRNRLSFCPEYWITKTMKWSDCSTQT